MANNDKSIASNIAAGVGNGIVGAAIGAATGAVTAGVLDATNIADAVAFSPSVEATKEFAAEAAKTSINEAGASAKEAASALVSGNFSEALNQAGNGLGQTVQAMQSVQARDFAENLINTATSETYSPQQHLAAQQMAFIEANNAHMMNEVKDVINLAKDPAAMAAAGAAVGGTYKGLEGVVKGPDNKHQLEHAISQQQQNAEAIAGLAGAAIAEAREAKAVIGKFTQLVQQQRASQHLREGHGVA